MKSKPFLRSLFIHGRISMSQCVYAMNAHWQVFETRDVVFPASGPLEPVYRSMTVWNEGDTSALFELEPDANQ